MYFDKAGRENTEATLKMAYERGKALGLTELVGSTPRSSLQIPSGSLVRGQRSRWRWLTWQPILGTSPGMISYRSAGRAAGRTRP